MTFAAQNPSGTPIGLASGLLTLESPVESELTDVVWIELVRSHTELHTKNVLNPPLDQHFSWRGFSFVT